MIVHIDSEYKCHVAAAEGTRAFEVPFFDGMSPLAVECYRYVPEDEESTREDGEVFKGEMIAPFVDSRIINAYQSQYASDLAERADMESALNTLGVTANG